MGNTVNSIVPAINDSYLYMDWHFYLFMAFEMVTSVLVGKLNMQVNWNPFKLFELTKEIKDRISWKEGEIKICDLENYRKLFWDKKTVNSSY